MSDNTPDKEIVVTVSHAEPGKIVITRKSGDTYTSKSEELIDFFHTADPARYHQSPVVERDERLVWVSVEDRLPEIKVSVDIPNEDEKPSSWSNWVLCANEYGPIVYCCMYDHQRKIWYGYGQYLTSTERVTHWMPLPQQPKV